MPFNLLNNTQKIKILILIHLNKLLNFLLHKENINKMK